MAESLAVIPLVVEALKLGKKLEEVLRTCRKAPSEILALGNELTELSLVMSEIDAAKEAGSSPLHQILNRAESQLKALETLIGMFPMTGQSKSRRNRLKWVRARKHALALQDEIRTTKGNLSVLLAARTMFVTPLSPVLSWLIWFRRGSTQISLAIDELQVQKDQSHDIQFNSIKAISSELGLQQQQMSLISSELSHVKEIQQRGLDLLESISTQRQKPPRPQNHDKVASEMIMGEAYSRGRHKCVPIQNGCAGATTVDRLMQICEDPRIDFVKVRAKSSSKRSCGRACACQCHRITQLKTSSLLGPLIGSLFLGYCGSPTRKTACNEWSCRNNSSFRLRFTYYFVSHPPTS